jgi:hypothetical protein
MGDSVWTDANDPDVSGRQFLGQNPRESLLLRGLGRSAGGGDVGCHGVEPGQCPPGDEDPCAFLREYLRHGAADSATASVDHSVLVMKQHCILFSLNYKPVGKARVPAA